jgi:hypothetical protein
MRVGMSFVSLINLDLYDKCSLLHEYFMQGFEMFEHAGRLIDVPGLLTCGLLLSLNLCPE